MKQLLFILGIFALLWSCSKNPETETGAGEVVSWEETLEAARGSRLTMMMWQGDPLINAYMNDYIRPAVKERFDIDLQLVNGQGAIIVSTLMTELEAGKQASEIDMMWINGETFFQLRHINGLYGPFLDQLPNSRYLKLDNPFIGIDFQQPIAGYECPWGNVQLAYIYNAEQVEALPQSLEDLEAWVKANPGKFTIGNDFTGMTVLKSWLITLAGGDEAIAGEFDPHLYERYSSQLWAYVNRLKPFLWNRGESFPANVAQMHQLFTNGELYFTMSNNDSEVDNKILQGIFPESSRAYVPKMGTIQNTHYLGISKRSANKAAAKLVINFMISPEAQFRKMQPQVWGDATVLDLGRLSEEWQDKFKDIPGRKYAPSRDSIQSRALMEPAPEYMIRLFDDFRKEVMEQ